MLLHDTLVSLSPSRALRTYVCAWVWVTTVMASCFVTLGAAAHQSPLSMAFSGQEHWRGLPYPPPGDLPNPGTEPASHVSCTRRLVFTPGTTGKVLHPYNTFFHTFFGCILFDQLFILQLSSVIILNKNLLNNEKAVRSIRRKCRRNYVTLRFACQRRRSGLEYKYNKIGHKLKIVKLDRSGVYSISLCILHTFELFHSKI